jgi:hypothetical protein
VAKKISSNAVPQAHLTSTGIFSPLAPSPSTPEEGALSKHGDVIAEIEMSAAKASLYRGFRRGAVIAGKELEETKPTVEKAQESVDGPKRKRRKMVEREDGTTAEETPAERQQRKLRKAARRAAREST